MGYSTDLNDDGYDDFGWAIEIDPAPRTIINQQVEETKGQTLGHG